MRFPVSGVNVEEEKSHVIHFTKNPPIHGATRRRCRCIQVAKPVAHKIIVLVSFRAQFGLFALLGPR
jgi:hypothetical protein